MAREKRINSDYRLVKNTFRTDDGAIFDVEVRCSWFSEIPWERQNAFDHYLINWATETFGEIHRSRWGYMRSGMGIKFSFFNLADNRKFQKHFRNNLVLFRLQRVEATT